MILIYLKCQILKHDLKLKRRKRIIKKSKPIDPDNIQWSDLVPQILAVYNNKKRREKKREIQLKDKQQSFICSLF